MNTQKKVNILNIINQVERQKDLTQFEKFEKVVDIAYKRIYKVKDDNWKARYNKADILTEVVEKETKEGFYSKTKEVIKEFLPF